MALQSVMEALTLRGEKRGPNEPAFHFSVHFMETLSLGQSRGITNASASLCGPQNVKRSRTSPSSSSVPSGSAPRMSDVAAAAGVSLVTVSRCINQPDKVTPETLALVRAAVERLGYVPNLTAGSLASNRSRIVAAIVPTISNSVFSEMVEALASTLSAGGYQLLLGQSSYRADDEERLVDAFLGRRVDGLVLTGAPRAEQLAQRLRRNGLPVVQTWDLPLRPIDMAVGFSNFDTGMAAGRFLAGKGRRRIGFLGASEDRAAQRLAGLRAALADAGLLPPEVETLPPPVLVDKAGPGLSAMLERAPDLDAIFCNNDLLAAGVLFECQRRAVRVPDDLAVLGFGDLPIGTAAFPALSTIRIGLRGMGEQAGRLLLARFAGEGNLPGLTDLGFEVVQRDSA
ncbi:LacI family DNA-binding transcriptional regulator [Variovorax sp.]|nr:LacI family DNA-binding transcriptional regulator [Variovorax sp.]